MNDWAEFRHFKYLLAIVEHGGIRPAAEVLYTSEPNLSVQAKQFQEMVGIRLYERTRAGRLKFTRTAAAFPAIAREVLEIRDHAIALLAAIERDLIQAFRIACGPHVDSELLGLACTLHRKLVPQSPVHPTHAGMGSLVEDLQAGRLDVALALDPIPEPRLHAEPIRRDRLVACMRGTHPLAAKVTLDPSDLKPHPLLFWNPQDHPEARLRVEGHLLIAGLCLDTFCTASNSFELQSLVRASNGIALVPEGSVSCADLVTRPITRVDLIVSTMLVFNPDRRPDSLPILARQLQRAARQDGPNVSEQSQSMLALTEGPAPKRPPESDRIDTSRKSQRA